MKFLFVLLASTFVALPIYAANAENEDDKDFLLANERAVAAIKTCNQFGASYCHSDLALATEQIVNSFDNEKRRLSKLACTSPQWTTTTDRYLIIVKGFGTGVARIMEGTAALGRTDRSELANVKELSTTFNRVIRFGAEMLLTTGDLALQAGCREEADRSYRAVLASFVSEDMSAYRERARVGIEDVRNSRGLFCRVVGRC
ncbi:hypothetical protein [Bradyrhizobium sp. SSUT77]|uniref:hypothetical protein n=1 Tax=Bradyrhizobium sp. SSUT77 TaxID=3040603 RepID=UPI00244894D1|nr:hypothetical protein [Bradyrhizobium sp. SSUT77]MDH2341477.1 hypothetical protein [Bradyrhizobium sp. SSUT77]